MNGIVINIKYKDPVYLYFCGDNHFGNKNQNKKKLKSDLDRALELNAIIFIGGDWSDMIMSGDKKRYSPSGDIYNSDNNIMRQIEEAEKFYMQYAKNIKQIQSGNHETAVQKYHNIDPTYILIDRINEKCKTNITHGQYSGFIKLVYKHLSTRSLPYDIYYNHGQGGRSEITKGTIDINRHLTTKDADCIWIQHKHTKVILPDEKKLYFDRKGKIRIKTVKAFVTGGYISDVNQYNAITEKGYKLDYGEVFSRTLQAEGGIFLKQTIKNMEINTEIIL